MIADSENLYCMLSTFSLELKQGGSIFYKQLIIFEMFFSWQVIKNKSYIFIDQWDALRCHFPHTHKYISNIDL